MARYIQMAALQEGLTKCLSKENKRLLHRHTQRDNQFGMQHRFISCSLLYMLLPDSNQTEIILAIPSAESYYITS